MPSSICWIDSSVAVILRLGLYFDLDVDRPLLGCSVRRLLRLAAAAVQSFEIDGVEGCSAWKEVLS